MKPRRLQALLMGVALAAVSAASYALRENPAPEPLAIGFTEPLPAQEERGFAGETRVTYPAAERQPPHEQVEWADAAPSARSYEPVAAEAPSLPDRRGDDPDSRGRDAMDPTQANAGEVAAGAAPLPVQAGYLHTAYSAGGVVAIPNAVISVPLAFQPATAAAAAADPATADAVQGLQKQFIDAIGGPNQDPSDPAYAQRWSDAQEVADQQFLAKFGSQAFLAEQIEINSNAK